MAPRLSLLFFCLVALIQASLQLAPSRAAAIILHQGSLIQQVCSYHKNPKFCFDQLYNAALLDLGRVGIRLATARANDTSHIQSLLATEKNPETNSLLGYCLDDYKEASASLDEAAIALAQGDYSEVDMDASVASMSGTICEYRFGEEHVKSPITDENRAMTDLAQIVQIVANLLAGGTLR